MLKVKRIRGCRRNASLFWRIFLKEIICLGLTILLEKHTKNELENLSGENKIILCFFIG